MVMRWVNLLKANIRKEYIELKRYLPNTIAMLFTFYIIFLGVFAGIQLFGVPSAAGSNTQFAIVNYIVWCLARMMVNDIGYDVMYDAIRGTLEQLSLLHMVI